MKDPQPGSGNTFDLERIRSLILLMQEHEVRELELRERGMKIRLSRGAAAPLPVAEPLPPPQVKPPPGPPPEESANLALIKSPMVGTFFARPNPEAEPYVKVGDHVEPDTPVCLIEAMKTYNPIPAEVRGRIVAVLVDNEEAVEYGTPLFKVDTSK